MLFTGGALTSFTSHVVNIKVVEVSVVSFPAYEFTSHVVNIKDLPKWFVKLLPCVFTSHVVNIKVAQSSSLNLPLFNLHLT